MVHSPELYKLILFSIQHSASVIFQAPLLEIGD